LYNDFAGDTINTMATREESVPAAELHFEGDSREVLASFPDDVKRLLGFSLRQTRQTAIAGAEKS
jgi:hypothetical protein